MKGIILAGGSGTRLHSITGGIKAANQAWANNIESGEYRNAYSE